MDQLDTHEELKMIRKTLRETGLRIKFRAEVAKPANLRELLLSGVRMLHYTGHGNNEFLAFESDEDRLCGEMEPLHVEPLKTLFQAGNVRTGLLVFVSSCSSELVGNAFVEAGVPHVVAAKRDKSANDQAAQQFATRFYDALLSEGGMHTVKQAFDIALNIVNADDPNAPSRGDHFLLLPPDGDHDVRIFDALLEGDFIDVTRLPPPRPCFVRPVPFYKGLEELQRVVEIVVDPVPACVTITGERGSGKTERAIQACDYVRMRHHFDSVLWADVKKAVGEATAVSANMWAVYDDPCRLIGVAAGMPQPGPNTEEELIQFLFKNPTKEGGRQCQKVLLVLEDADSLFEGGGDAQDRLIILLSNLCCMGEHLKLLVTSERSLLRETIARFRHGSETLARVKKLRPRDAAQLLVDMVPTCFTRTELGLKSNCTRDDILAKLEAHPVLQAADGHPGTLLRLAPLLEDHRLNDACVLQSARRHRLEYQLYVSSSQTHTLKVDRSTNSTSLATSPGSDVSSQRLDFLRDFSMHSTTNSSSPTNSTSHATPFDSNVSSPKFLFQPENNRRPTVPWWPRGDISVSGMGRNPGISHHKRRHSSYPHSQSQRWMPMQDHLIAMQELELKEPEPPTTMASNEKRAWDTASSAALMDRGCRLVWVKAFADAAADGWRYHGGGGNGGEGGTGGWAMGSGVADEEMARYDCVPWDYLREGLKQHLCGQLTIPSNQDEVVDDGPYGWVNDEFGGGNGGGDAGGMAEGGGYQAVNTPQVRCMNEDDLAFVRGVLKTKQEKVRRNQERLRKQRGYDGSELGSAGGVAVDGSAGSGGVGNGGGSDDAISLDVFVEFSLWWAPLMRTLSLLRNDWGSMDPIRVHGFIGRLEAERQLQHKERGTFLLRFSESKPGTLVVSFTEHVTPRSPMTRLPMTCIKHCLVEVRRGGRCFIEVEQGKKMPYNSLHDLIRACLSVRTLYPNVPKDEAFYNGGGASCTIDAGISTFPTDVQAKAVSHASRDDEGDGAMLKRDSKPVKVGLVDAGLLTEVEGETLVLADAGSLTEVEGETHIIVPPNLKVVPRAEKDQGSDGTMLERASKPVKAVLVDVGSLTEVEGEAQIPVPQTLMCPPHENSGKMPAEGGGQIREDGDRATGGIGEAEAASEAIPKNSIADSPELLGGTTGSRCPSSGKGKEILATRLDCDREEVTLKSDLHALEVVVPSLKIAVNASIFVDNSASSTVIEDKMHVILPIVTCGPAGLSFAQPLRLRFHLCGTEGASESSDDDSNDSACNGSGDDRSSGCGDGYEQRLKSSHKVVMQKGSDTSSKDWTVLDGTLVSEGDKMLLEANISHFCRFGLAQEVGMYEETGGYIEAGLAGKSKKNGIARFVNLSDHTATFYLQPKVFDIKRHESGGFSVLEKLSASFSKRVERTALATETTLFVDTVQLGPNEFGDARIGESVGLQASVAVTTSQHETVSGWLQSVCVRKVRVWDIKTATHKKALILLNGRFVPPKYAAYGHFSVNVSDEEANIARKVYDAIKK